MRLLTDTDYLIKDYFAEKKKYISDTKLLQSFFFFFVKHKDLECTELRDTLPIPNSI